MFEIIHAGEDGRWDRIVKTFPDYDVYYLSGYIRAFELHGDGTPLLLYYESEGLRAVCSVFSRPIEDAPGYTDIITPYGYGGFIFDGDRTEENMERFKEAFFEAMKREKVVSAFFRYHPLSCNADAVRSIFPITDLGPTIDMGLQDAETIAQNLSRQNRNKIRKAQKNGVTIGWGKGMPLFERFMEVYNATMDRDHATPYYYFGREFYESIDRDLNDHYRIFYAEYEGQIIAMSIILFAGKWVHYHLSGSLTEYRHLAPTNLLLYEVALWAAGEGYERFHLGGGVGAAEDDLYKFKEGFNRTGANRFCTGKIIFDPAKYDALVAARCEQDAAFDRESHFFPLYRA